MVAPSPTPRPEREYVPCNLCGSQNHAPWAVVRGAQLVRCRNCGLVFTNPRLTAETLHASYEEEYSAQHEDPVLLSQRRRMYELERAEILRTAGRLPAGPSARFLDVGCGTGEFLSLMREEFEVYGVEVSQGYLRIARERHALPHLFHGELTEAAFGEGFFDVVQMRGVLQHLPDPLRQVREACRVTRAGGLLVISATPNIASPAARVFGANFRLLAPDQMVYNFSPRTLRRLLEQAGWRVEQFTFPYLNTPYFRIYQGAEFVLRALQLGMMRLLRLDASGVRSPAFFGSMITCHARKP